MNIKKGVLLKKQRIVFNFTYDDEKLQKKNT
jgi:hypothetical protein